MERRATWNSRVATTLFAATIAVALLVPGGSSSAAKSKQWHYMYSRHYADSNGFGIKDDDERFGTGRIVDIFISPSAERFRNRPGGVRKRVYRVQGRITFDMKDDDFGLRLATCGQKVPPGSYALNSPRGKRLFFPRERSSLVQHQALGSVGLSAGPVEVSLPFPAFDYYTYADTRPTVLWATKTSRKHAWGWTSPVEPSGESFGFAGHWAAAARGTQVKIRCSVVANDGIHFAGGEIKLRRAINP